jgi:hypothetical protein
LRHPFKKSGNVPRTSRRHNPLVLASWAIYWKEASDLFRNLSLCSYFGEKREVMKRLSLQSLKWTYKERQLLLACHIHLRNKGIGTDGLRLPR